MTSLILDLGVGVVVGPRTLFGLGVRGLDSLDLDVELLRESTKNRVIQTLRDEGVRPESDPDPEDSRCNTGFSTSRYGFSPTPVGWCRW